MSKSRRDVCVRASYTVRLIDYQQGCLLFDDVNDDWNQQRYWYFGSSKYFANMMLENMFSASLWRHDRSLWLLNAAKSFVPRSLEIDSFSRFKRLYHLYAHSAKSAERHFLAKLGKCDAKYSYTSLTPVPPVFHLLRWVYTWEHIGSFSNTACTTGLVQQEADGGSRPLVVSEHRFSATHQQHKSVIDSYSTIDFIPNELWPNTNHRVLINTRVVAALVDRLFSTDSCTCMCLWVHLGQLYGLIWVQQQCLAAQKHMTIVSYMINIRSYQNMGVNCITDFPMYM